jgi:hypothetical protein
MLRDTGQVRMQTSGAETGRIAAGQMGESAQGGAEASGRPGSTPGSCTGAGQLE